MNEKDFIYSKDIQLSGIVKWTAPSNIAIVKYWGKLDNQIPQNPSISLTLNKSITSTTLSLKPKNNKISNLRFEFEGLENKSFENKTRMFLNKIEKFFPYIRNHDLEIKSNNTFPHSSGIASSASSMAALSACLVDFEKMDNTKMSDEYFYKKASFIARIGSGSASRSLYGPVVIWGESKAYKSSNDLYGINISSQTHQIFKEFNDTILIIDPGQKKISSSEGHNLMNKNPFSTERYQIARKNIIDLKEILKVGDLDGFISITESEALMIHSLMLTSNPSYILMKPNTLKVISKITEFRSETKLPVCFTLDAGSNVHLLYPNNIKNKVSDFVNIELADYCSSNKYIEDQVGNGPKKMT
jgi:diphosphomevalonate decarboxylase